MKELLRIIDQKCDDRVANFHKSLMILFLIKVVSISMMLGVIMAPFMFFQDNLWMKLLGGTILLFSPVSILNAVYLYKNASDRFWPAFQEKMLDWFD